MNTSNPHRVFRVALPVPLPQLFDYLPGQSEQHASVGGRVVVPFGRRKLVGIVVEDDARAAAIRR